MIQIVHVTVHEVAFHFSSLPIIQNHFQSEISP
jgi:hypothetical protein